MIQISIVASSIRPKLWMDLWESLQGNQIRFELILVGDNPPSYNLPERTKFIYSKVKPAQCYEIGFRVAQGELIHWTTDEAIYNYEKPNTLDIIYRFYKKFNRKDLIVGFSCRENNGTVFSLTSPGHYLSVAGTPQMVSFGVIDRQFFLNELGGYDRRFITGQAENDVCMRLYERNGKIEMCNEAVIAVYHNKAHTDYPDTNSRFRKWQPQSRAFLDECWGINGITYSKTRLIPFESFSNDQILTLSQEPKGEWE